MTTKPQPERCPNPECRSTNRKVRGRLPGDPLDFSCHDYWCEHPWHSQAGLPPEFSDSVEQNKELLERLAGQTPEQGGPQPMSAHDAEVALFKRRWEHSMELRDILHAENVTLREKLSELERERQAERRDSEDWMKRALDSEENLATGKTCLFCPHPQANHSSEGCGGYGCECCWDGKLAAPSPEKAGAEPLLERLAGQTPEQGGPRRWMKLPGNSAYPAFNEVHREDDWCKSAGCTPVCDRMVFSVDRCEDKNQHGERCKLVKNHRTDHDFADTEPATAPSLEKAVTLAYCSKCNLRRYFKDGKCEVCASPSPEKAGGQTPEQGGPCAKCGHDYVEHSREALTTANDHRWTWANSACPIGDGPFHPTQTFEPAPSPEKAGALVVEIARELYDRFVMGGWEPQDAYPQIERWLESIKNA